MKKALVIMLCFTMFLFTACSEPTEKQATASTAPETATAAVPLSTVIPTFSSAPEPTVIPTPSPASEPTTEPSSSPTPHPTPHPSPDNSAIVGYWYSTTDPGLSVKFRDDGTAVLFGAEGDCISYEFDPGTLTGTMMIDEGSGIAYPFPFSIEDGNLHFIGDILSRTEHPLAPIYGSWHCVGSPDLCIVFYGGGYAEFYGIEAECTGYEFDTGSLTGTIWLDDGGGPFSYNFSIVGGNLHMLGEVYTRS